MKQAKVIPPSEVVNNEFPFHELNGFLTPNEKFYVRSHFPFPEMELDTWRLSIEGAVERPLVLTHDELTRMPMHTVAATLECAGNSRMHLNPPVKGLQWDRGAVSNAEWTGVPLATLLERAGASEQAAEIIFEGCDSGVIAEHPAPAGPIHFAFSIPLDRACDGGTILAYQMNGEPLPLSHGFPLRAIVPGYYAMASVKWLRRVIVTETPFQGYYQTIDYSYWRMENGIPVRTPLSRMGVKSLIARPAAGDSLIRNCSCRVVGAAWTSDAEITSVAVSWDGEEWLEARLLGEPVKNAWRLWECDTTTPAHAGRYELVARATDSLGNQQPAKHDYNNCNYVIHHVIPVAVDVR